MKVRLAVPDAACLSPLVYELDKPESSFELVRDFPSSVALKFAQRADALRAAFVSPIDYARHGADYCIVPGIAAASSTRTDTVRLFVRRETRDIRTLAGDIRVTSEIILAKIILLERIENITVDRSLQFIPMFPDLSQMLQKADAALVVELNSPASTPADTFSLDLVEEWYDMTGLPYVHGFWIGREEEFSQNELDALVNARDRGTAFIDRIAQDLAAKHHRPTAELQKYLSSFSYELGTTEQESVTEYTRYAYFHGVIGDIPELRFF